MLRPPILAPVLCALVAAHGANLLADTFGSNTNEFTVEFTTIRDLGNSADPRNGLGAIGYAYRIGTYEVSTAMINRANDVAGLALEPVAFPAGSAAGGISWNNAARFINWLNTNSGYAPAYKFAAQPGQAGYSAHADIQVWQPGDLGYDPANPYRNKLAMYFLPSESEWCKAAYYNPSASNYFLYPTASDSAPASVSSGTNADTAVFIGNGGNGDTAPTDSAGGRSPYGTMAQGGNAREWTESNASGSNDAPSAARSMRGGGLVSAVGELTSTNAISQAPGNRDLSFGFRVASLVALADTNAYLSSLVPSSGALSPVAGTTDATPPSSVVLIPTFVWHEFYGIQPYNYGNATMNSRPVFAPFTSPDPGASRMTGNYPNSVAVAGALDGSGTSVAERIGGTTTAFGYAYNNYALTESAPGVRLPNAAGTGTLSATIVLADGTIIPAGTRVFLDLQGYRLDPNKPADLWHDQSSGITTQIYEGGTADFYYYDPSALNSTGLPQGYRRFASYTNASVTGLNNYVANTNSYAWSGTPAPVAGSILPAQSSISSSNAIGIGFSVLPAELNATDPYLGFFFTQTRSFTFNFNQGALSTGGFGALTRGYRSTVPWGASNYSLTPSVAGLGASVTVNSNAVTPGTASASAPLGVGTNSFSVVVTAGEGGGTREYTVEVVRAPFSGAGGDFSGQNFAGQDLRDADAAGANFSGANLTGANLSRGNFTSANLAGATLTGVDLQGADLAGATLTGVVSGGITGTPAALPSNWTLVNGTLVPPDTTGPVITLIGPNPFAVALGAAFTDPGATVTDNIDPPRTIYGTGAIDTSKAGTYSLVYEATDSAGNTATPVTRAVVVLVAPQNVGSMDLGGTVQVAGDRRNVGFVGAPGVVATAEDGVRVARQGGSGMVYFPTGYSVAADSSAIREAGSTPESSTRTALSAREDFDDQTFAAATTPVAWSPATNQAISVSADGIARANAVYQDTLAAFSATLGGIAATNYLTVLNALPDNYEAWAGDTFDDAWEIAQGMAAAVDPDASNNGTPNWQLYAMGVDPSATFSGQLSTGGATNGYFAITYTRNPFATNYTFAVQESGNRALAFTNMLAPVSSTNTVDGVEQITTWGSAPINATNRQFLRVKIMQPAP